MRTFGSEAGLTSAEIGEAQRTFLDSYMAHYEALAGRSPAEGFSTATTFYQANLDTIALRAAAERARTLRPSTDEARTAAARVAELVDALKATLGLPSRFATRSTNEETL